MNTDGQLMMMNDVKEKPNILIFLGFGLWAFLLIIILVINETLSRHNTPDIMYYTDVCNNGDYCDFCEDKCICKKGYSTESDCLELIDDEPFYNVSWWNYMSNRVYSTCYSTEGDCEDECILNPICVAYIWNPCVNHVLPCTGHCKHIKNIYHKTKPIFITGYEPLPSEFIPPRRNIESTFIGYQEKLFVKTGQDCWGYLCHYNDKYGFVFIDEETHHIHRSTMKTVISFTHNMLFDDQYFIDILNDMNVTLKVKDSTTILEITEMPILQTPRLFDVEKITVISSSATLYNSMDNSDFRNYNLTINQINNVDLSESLVKPDKTYDIVFLMYSMFGRKSLSALLANAYNHIKPGGVIAIWDKHYSYINSTVLYNKCMLAGMPKKQFTTDFFNLFDEMFYSEMEDEIEPSDSSVEPFIIRDEYCWQWSNEFYHPNHLGNWFYFVGRKQ